MKTQFKMWMACLGLLPTALMAQTPATNIPSGTPQGVARVPGNNSVGFPTPLTVEGKPIESRPPELEGDHPVFAGQTRAPFHATAPYTVTTITDKLNAPWSLAFLPDGKMLVTQKGGELHFVDAKGTISPAISGVPAVDAIGQVGLLDVALDPAFATNHRVFFTFSEAASVPGSNAANSNIVIASARLDEAAGAITNVSVIFRAKPSLPRMLAANEGGRIAIARDGTLFATIGDRSGSPPWDMAQRLDTDLGKIIHITAEGKPAKDNPFIGETGALPEIWSIGHRSEEGLAINPATGELWENENGPRGGDKLLKIEAGKNYGWPVYVHGIDYPGEKIGQGIVEQAGMEQPVYYWDPVIAPSGMAFYTGNLFPQWKNSVFIGGLRGMMLDRLTLAGDKVVNEEALLVDQHSRIRDVRIGPEGAVYVLTDAPMNAKLLKLTPK